VTRVPFDLLDPEAREDWVSVPCAPSDPAAGTFRVKVREMPKIPFDRIVARYLAASRSFEAVQEKARARAKELEDHPLRDLILEDELRALSDKAKQAQEQSARELVRSMVLEVELPEGTAPPAGLLDLLCFTALHFQTLEGKSPEEIWRAKIAGEAGADRP
jgi:hypothetical protein